MAAISLVSASACGPRDATNSPAAATRVRLALQPVALGFTFPIYVTAAPGDPGRLFVVEKGGRIRVIRDGVVLPKTFLDLRGKVTTGEEQGLLGLAFDPAYAATGRFYVSYTDLDGTTRIVRYHVSADRDIADPGSADTVLSIEQVDDSHHGGMLAFGRDGYLWISTGDGNGRTIDSQNNGQDATDLLGSLLRIDVRGASGYANPPDNPYRTLPARPELWNIGLRNPWRFSFDRVTGDLYIGDVGEAQFEEIDVAAAARGLDPRANYGWKILEATRCVDEDSCGRGGLTDPVLTYPHANGCCVVGGYVYRGAAIPALHGTYFYGDLCGGWIRSFRYVGGRATADTPWPTLDTRGHVTSFGEDAAGELYVVTQEGGVYRIVSETASFTAVARVRVRKLSLRSHSE